MEAVKKCLGYVGTSEARFKTALCYRNSWTVKG